MSTASLGTGFGIVRDLPPRRLDGFLTCNRTLSRAKSCLLPLSLTFACAAPGCRRLEPGDGRETSLAPSDLIWPLFIAAGDEEEPIASLPGVSRWPVARIGERVREARDLGIPCVALFPNTPPGLRTPDAKEALNPGNLICRAVQEAKAAAPEVGVLTDVALDPYTAHGHDGVTDEDGCVLNDETVELLTDQALVQAHAGADIIAPSDMMDGRIGAIRSALERAGHCNVQIMAYAAKYASAFYGPFRDAVGSRGLLKGDKKTYQMDPRNASEALREVALDVAEGRRPCDGQAGACLSRHHLAGARAGSSCRSSLTRCPANMR
jgi:porphobilinogen synthase